MELMDKQNWSQQIPTILFALRGTPSVKSTMFSPFYIMFGQEMRFPFDLPFPALAEPHLSAPDMTSKERDNNSLIKYVEVLNPRLELIRQLARENIVEAQLQYKIQFDKKVKEIIFEVGSKVLLFTPHNRLGTN